MAGNKKAMSINTSNLLKWSSVAALVVVASTMVYGAVGGPKPSLVQHCKQKCSKLPGKICIHHNDVVCCCVDSTTGKHICACMQAPDCPGDQDDNCPKLY